MTTFISSWFGEVADLPCTTFKRDTFIQVDWLMLSSLDFKLFFDSWFALALSRRSPAAQVGCGVSALVIFLWFDWFTASQRCEPSLCGFGALIALRL